MPYDDPTTHELLPRYLDLIATYSDTDEATSGSYMIIVYSYDDVFDGFERIPCFHDEDFGDHITPSWTWLDLESEYPQEMPAPASSYEVIPKNTRN